MNSPANILAALTLGVLSIQAQSNASAIDSNTKNNLSIKTIAHGIAPFLELRYKPKYQQKPTVYSLSSKMGIEIIAENKIVRSVEQPSYTFTLEQLTSGNDVHTAEFVVVGGHLHPGGPIPSEQRPAAEQRIQATTGTKYSFPIDPRGLPVVITCTPSEKSIPAITSSLKELLDPFKTLIVPLPAEKIGVGAKWDVVVPLQQNGVTTTFNVRYELKSLSGDKMNVSAKMRIPLDPNKYPVPFPESFSKNLTSLVLVFDSEIEQQLSRAMPNSATFNINVEMDTKIEAEGAMRDITGRTKMNLSWSTERAEIPTKTK